MTGLEPATSGVTGRCSNQLSYIPRSCGVGSSVRLPRSISLESEKDPEPPAVVADALILSAGARLFKGSALRWRMPRARLLGTAAGSSR